MQWEWEWEWIVERGKRREGVREEGVGSVGAKWGDLMSGGYRSRVVVEGEGSSDGVKLKKKMNRKVIQKVEWSCWDR